MKTRCRRTEQLRCPVCQRTFFSMGIPTSQEETIHRHVLRCSSMAKTRKLDRNLLTRVVGDPEISSVACSIASDHGPMTSEQQSTSWANQSSEERTPAKSLFSSSSNASKTFVTMESECTRPPSPSKGTGTTETCGKHLPSCVKLNSDSEVTSLGSENTLGTSDSAIEKSNNRCDVKEQVRVTVTVNKSSKSKSDKLQSIGAPKRKRARSSRSHQENWKCPVCNRAFHSYTEQGIYQHMLSCSVSEQNGVTDSDKFQLDQAEEPLEKRKRKNGHAQSDTKSAQHMTTRSTKFKDDLCHKFEPASTQSATNTSKCKEKLGLQNLKGANKGFQEYKVQSFKGVPSDEGVIRGSTEKYDGGLKDDASCTWPHRTKAKAKGKRPREVPFCFSREQLNFTHAKIEAKDANETKKIITRTETELPKLRDAEEANRCSTGEKEKSGESLAVENEPHGSRKVDEQWREAQRSNLLGGDEGRRVRSSQPSTTQCPVCQKVFQASETSVTEINRHVLLCSEAQKKETFKVGGPYSRLAATTSSPLFKGKWRRDFVLTKPRFNVDSFHNCEDQRNRSASLKSLRVGGAEIVLRRILCNEFQKLAEEAV